MELVGRGTGGPTSAGGFDDAPIPAGSLPSSLLPARGERREEGGGQGDRRPSLTIRQEPP
jgi:hypothetical protein